MGGDSPSELDGAIDVLHVDDDPELCDVIAAFLERSDQAIAVETAHDAHDGLDVLAERTVDCVVSDFEMPGRNGIEFLEAVRAEHPDLPFILFTGKGSEEVASDAISAGVTDYLQKGTGTEQYAILANRIANYVDRTRARRERERMRERMELALEHTDSVAFEVDRSTGGVTRLGNFASFFETDPDEVPTWEDHLERVVHPGDREAFREFYRSLVDGDRKSGTLEYRTDPADGDVRWIRDDVSVEGEDSDRILGLARNVTGTRTTDRERHRRLFEEVVENVDVGVAVYGEDGRFAFANDAYAAMLDIDRETLEASAIWEVNPRIDRERFDDYWASFDDGETRTAETVHVVDGQNVPVRTTTTCREIDGTRYHFGTVQDVTERKEQEERFRSFVEGSNDILTVLDADGTYQYQSPSSARILGYGPDEMVGEDPFQYIHPDDREDVYDEFERALANPEAVLTVEYRFQHADGSWRWLESRGNNQFDNPAVEGFVVNSRDITDRKVHERQIAEVQRATREMVQAGDLEEVCEIAVATAERNLEFPITGIWLADDDDGDRLEPVATTETSQELFSDHPVYTEGNSLSWRAYTTGESFVFDDLRAEADAYNQDSEVRSELVIPLGEYGVMNMGSTEPDAFTANDVALGKLLGANAQAALARAERERDLQRQTAQMEFFNSILRHDVLNAVTVIGSRGEFLAAELEGEQARYAETIVSWSRDVEEIVQRVRSVLDTLTGSGDARLEPVDLVAALRTEVDRVRSTYPQVTFETDVPESVTVLGNDLLGDVLGNVVTNAIDHNDAEDLCVSVTVEERNGNVDVRVADDGRGVPDEHKEAIFRRDETGRHAKSTGSGFGLFFVDAMVAEYGGDVRVEDNDDGGATFVLTFQAAEPEAA